MIDIKSSPLSHLVVTSIISKIDFTTRLLSEVVSKRRLPEVNMTEANFRLPNPLNLTEGNLSEQYKKWQRQVEIYMEASGATSKPPRTQAAIILHCAGPQALEVFDQLNFEDEGKKDRMSQKLL